MTPMGVQVGAGLSKSRKITLLLGVCFVLGVLITVAEPDLSVLAEQVSANHTDYTDDQLASFKAMLQDFDIVKKWDIPNLI